MPRLLRRRRLLEVHRKVPSYRIVGQHKFRPDLSRDEWPTVAYARFGTDLGIGDVTDRIDRVDCPQCHGAGKITMFTSASECERCDGGGWYYEYKWE